MSISILASSLQIAPVLVWTQVSIMPVFFKISYNVIATWLFSVSLWLPIVYLYSRFIICGLFCLCKRYPDPDSQPWQVIRYCLEVILDEHFKFVICRIPWRRRERVQLINYTLQILGGLQGREVMVKRKLNELIICVGWNLRLLNLYIACLSSLLNPLYKCVQRYFF